MKKKHFLSPAAAASIKSKLKHCNCYSLLGTNCRLISLYLSLSGAARVYGWMDEVIRYVIALPLLRV